MSAENIRKIYDEMIAEDAVEFGNRLREVQDMAKCAQDAFDELAEKNADLGAGVIPPILRCITSHVIKAACDPDLTLEERRAEVGAYLAPMIAMHYDVYTRGCLNDLDSVLNVDFPEENQPEQHRLQPELQSFQRKAKMSFFKRQWISQEVIDYLMGLPPMYRIFYRVRTNKDYVASFLFRDDAGKLVADLYAKNVIGIDVRNQDDPDCARIYVEGRTDEYTLSLAKKVVGAYMAQQPKTQSDLNAGELESMQYKLREAIEKALHLIIPDGDKNIALNFGMLSPEYKRRVADLLLRFDGNCVPVTINIDTMMSTDEEIGATLDEIAMYEMGRDEREKQNDEGDTDDGDDTYEDEDA